MRIFWAAVGTPCKVAAVLALNAAREESRLSEDSLAKIPGADLLPCF